MIAVEKLQRSIAYIEKQRKIIAWQTVSFKFNLLYLQNSLESVIELPEKPYLFTIFFL